MICIAKKNIFHQDQPTKMLRQLEKKVDLKYELLEEGELKIHAILARIIVFNCQTRNLCGMAQQTTELHIFTIYSTITSKVKYLCSFFVEKIYI